MYCPKGEGIAHTPTNFFLIIFIFVKLLNNPHAPGFYKNPQEKNENALSH
jgi:hypothetical protein